WGRQDEGKVIDRTARMFDGTKVDGPNGVRKWLVGYSDQFAEVAIEKLLTYALGRGVEYQDMPLVRSIAHTAAKDGNKFSTIVLNIVKSKPFLMSMKVQETSVQSNTKEKAN